MEKKVEDICNLFIKNTNFDSDICSISVQNTLLKNSVEDIFENNNVSNPFLNDDFSSVKMRKITQELTKALENNSIEKIKELKKIYEADEDFAKAKKLLNAKCKEIWNVYDSTKTIPQEAMKTLGITNQPELDTILGNSVKYFEKDNENTTTAYIISSTLNNKKMNYTIEDIHKYLVDMHLKEKCEYNFKTVAYLITNHNYDAKKLEELKIDIAVLKSALKTLSLKERSKFVLRNIVKSSIDLLYFS